ncbi:dihydrofolate reductase family protein [Nocardia terpenica]|uniref:dihydrofolate reductase family protein n=1 Tax=Nocardia terpenica TaxID=455432 RepID=UPI001EEC0F0B|nr:dihydrofolate reductase family protein [Nocardia terpenica]
MDPVTGNARLATDTLATELTRLRNHPGTGVIYIGGADLAATAIAEGLIDEYRQFLYPIILGAGTPYFPPLPKPLNPRLTESQTVNSRVIYLRYRAYAEFGAR